MKAFTWAFTVSSFKLKGSQSWKIVKKFWWEINILQLSCCFLVCILSLFAHRLNLTMNIVEQRPFNLVRSSLSILPSPLCSSQRKRIDTRLNDGCQQSIMFHVTITSKGLKISYKVQDETEQSLTSHISLQHYTFKAHITCTSPFTTQNVFHGKHFRLT